MTLQDIYTKFEICKTWEERYRLLIQLSKQLERPSDDELAQWQEIEGCESRLWFEFQSSPRSIKTYSDARLMQGLLFIVKTVILGSDFKYKFWVTHTALQREDLLQIIVLWCQR